MKILIIEDEFAYRKGLQVLLEELGECHFAKNGKEAIEAYKIGIEEKLPYDLLFLDIMMPEMNGHDVLKEIRKIEEEKNIIFGVKIIMTTVLEDSENIRNAFREQCDAYLIKPIQKEKIIRALRELNLID